MLTHSHRIFPCDLELCLPGTLGTCVDSKAKQLSSCGVIPKLINAADSGRWGICIAQQQDIGLSISGLHQLKVCFFQNGLMGLYISGISVNVAKYPLDSVFLKATSSPFLLNLSDLPPVQESLQSTKGMLHCCKFFTLSSK